MREFREQLVVGAPSDAQEQALRRFRDQLADGKVKVKFFARYPLHAKLYLAHLATTTPSRRPDSTAAAARRS